MGIRTTDPEKKHLRNPLRQTEEKPSLTWRPGGGMVAFSAQTSSLDCLVGLKKCGCCLAGLKGENARADLHLKEPVPLFSG